MICCIAQHGLSLRIMHSWINRGYLGTVSPRNDIAPFHLAWFLCGPCLPVFQMKIEGLCILKEEKTIKNKKVKYDVSFVHYLYVGFLVPLSSA